MNPYLDRLQAYPFERLRHLLNDVPPHQHLSFINLSIGEPAHPLPDCIREAFIGSVQGLSVYPPTTGTPGLRQAIAQWLMRRYQLPDVCPDAQVLVCAGSREALFALPSVILNPASPGIVLSPNPFYQIYEGAALLAGADIAFYNNLASQGYRSYFKDIPTSVWEKTRLIYTCSPGNPAGNIMTLDEWATLFELADKYDSVIAADECYSEIYFSEDTPPLGALQAAHLLGRTDFKRLLVFSSLSKRSNAPGLRSGFIAGDQTLIRAYAKYRTYHGSAISNATAAASEAAWKDEAHVKNNRALYREKFDAVYPILKDVLDVSYPEGSFYLWAGVPGCDQAFTKQLYQDQHVKVVPGSFLARHANGVNPGEGRIRLALVASTEACVEAALRINAFVRHQFSV